jgi:large subunit ribosomal protein L31
MTNKTSYGGRSENKMKKDIQPKYNVATVTCSTCGNEFEVGTTLTEIKVDTCSNCHPFYTGTQTFVQAAGKVEKFNRRYGIEQNQPKEEERDE